MDEEKNEMNEEMENKTVPEAGQSVDDGVIEEVSSIDREEEDAPKESTPEPVPAPEAPQDKAPAQSAPSYSYRENTMPDVSGYDRDEKEKHTFRNFCVLCLCALVFGAISGAVMYAINHTAENTAIEQVAEAVPETVGATVTVETEPSQYPLGGYDIEDIEDIYQYLGLQRGTAVVDVSGIVEEVMPSVVSITNTMLLQTEGFRIGWFLFSEGETYEVPSSGSGIIVGTNEDELLVATNYHVIEDSESLTVTFIDGTDVEAAVKGTDQQTDIAVIAIPLEEIPDETMEQITIATLGNSDELKLGQGVIAIGNSLGLGQSVTVGYVSALDREITVEGNTKRVIQTDAAINPGNSGGALLNMNGEVIGINEAKYNGSGVEGVGYAVPVSDVEEVINELMHGKTKIPVADEERGYLGVYLTTVDETAAQTYHMPAGAFVYDIVKGAPADVSGLKVNDIITKINGEKINDAEEMTELVSCYKIGETLTLTVQTQGVGGYVEHEVDVVLGERPEDMEDTVTLDEIERMKEEEENGDEKEVDEKEVDEDTGEDAEEEEDEIRGGMDRYFNPFEQFEQFMPGQRQGNRQPGERRENSAE